MHLNKKIILGLICLLFVALAILTATDNFYEFTKKVKDYKAVSVDMIDQRMASLFFEINNFPGGAGNDILFLSELSSLRDLVNADNGAARTRAKEKLTDDLLAFLKENPAYYQLRYIDEDGNEIVAVVYDGRDFIVISQAELSNRKDQYYFNEAIKLESHEVLISDFDLSVQDGELENRGTAQDPKYVPILVYAVPVFKNEGGQKGVIVSTIYADYFLDDIRNSQRKEESIFLINQDGYYLAHSDRSKEFGFLFDRDDTFYGDYHEFFKDGELDFKTRLFETEDITFIFRRIYPTYGSFAIHEGIEEIYGKNTEDNFFWVLISASNKSEINKMVENIKKNYLFHLLFFGTIILIIIALTFLLVFLTHKNEYR